MVIAFLTLERNVNRVAYEIKHEKAKEVGASLTLQKLVKNVPSGSSFAQGFWRIGDSNREILSKLHRIVYYIAFNRLAFTGFEHETELPKPHNIKFSAY